MFSRWYCLAIGVFWLAATGWLVKGKILPPLLVGEPPSYRTILADGPRDEAPTPVGWEIFLNDQRVGGAYTQTNRFPDGISQFECRVSLFELPLSELTPAWMTAFVQVLDREPQRRKAVIAVDSQTLVDIGALNQPIGFSSIAKIGPPASDHTNRTLLSGMELNVVMKGQIEGDAMNVRVHSGTLDYQTRIDLPQNALIGEALSPQTRLPGLRIGQTWTVPTYSPFQSPHAPMTMLHATVERKDPIFWHGEIVPALLVVYRGDPGLGLSSNQAARSQMWVNYQGDVIKQEVNLMSARLTFLRADPRHEPQPELMPDTSKPLRALPPGLDGLDEPIPTDSDDATPTP